MSRCPPPPLPSVSSTAGYVNFSSTHHDWSDGFRLVRKQKYGDESDGLSGDYKQLLAVGGLQGKEHLWPQILKDYVHVSLGYCITVQESGWWNIPAVTLGWGV